MLVPDVEVTCGACGEPVNVRTFLRLGDSHPDICRARPVLMRIDSDSEGRWFPLIQSPQNLTSADRVRIKGQIAEMISDFRRSKG